MLADRYLARIFWYFAWRERAAAEALKACMVRVVQTALGRGAPSHGHHACHHCGHTPTLNGS
jgi:hypothetical protein